MIFLFFFFLCLFIYWFVIFFVFYCGCCWSEYNGFIREQKSGRGNNRQRAPNRVLLYRDRTMILNASTHEMSTNLLRSQPDLTDPLPHHSHLYVFFFAPPFLFFLFLHPPPPPSPSRIITTAHTTAIQPLSCLEGRDWTKQMSIPKTGVLCNWTGPNDKAPMEGGT